MVEECIDNYVDHNLYDDRAHAVREGVKAVVLDRQPVAEVEDDFAEDSVGFLSLPNRFEVRNCIMHRFWLNVYTQYVGHVLAEAIPKCDA